MKVMGGSLNVRREPSLEAEVIHVLEDGEERVVGTEKDGWCKCGSGYVMAAFLAPVEEETPEPEQEAAKEIKEAAKEAAAKKIAKKKAADK